MHTPVQRPRTVRSVLLVDERIDRLQQVERALLAAGVGVQACARFEQAYYVADAPADVVLVAAETAARAGWTQAETLRAGGTGRVAALCYGTSGEIGDLAAEARRRGYEPVALDWSEPALLAEQVERQVVRAAPCVWVLSADERAGDRTWVAALERAGYGVRRLCDGREWSEGPGGHPFAVVVRDDAATVGSGPPADELRDLARDARLVVLGRDADAERRRAWREVGAVAYVEEPFHVEVLLAQLAGGHERRGAPLARETALGLLWVGLDRSGRVVEWNAAAAEFLAGPGASDVLPFGELNWYDLVCAPSAREECRDQLEGLADGRVDATTGEWPVSSHDGEVQWLHWTCRRATEVDEGQAAFVLLGVSDGLWRRWGRADYGAAVSGADRCGDTLLLLDRQLGQVVFAGSRALSWWGVGKDELARSTLWWERVAAGDHAPLRSAIERARRGEAVRCGFELESPGQVGRLVQARLFALEPKDRHGALIAVLLSEIGDGEPCAEPPAPRLESVTIEALLTAAPVVPFSIDSAGRLSLSDADLALELGLVDEEGRELALDVRQELPFLTERLQEAFDGRGFGVTVELAGRHVVLTLWPRFEGDEVTLVSGVAVDTSDTQRMREALRSLVDVTAAITGQAFFRELALALTRALGVRMAYLGERSAEHPGRLDLISCWASGEFTEGVVELGPGRPEQGALAGESVRLSPAEAAERCVGDPFRRVFDPGRGRAVAGYVAVPVRDAVGEVVGVLALAHDRPLDASLVDEGLLALLASRAGAEIERLRSEESVEHQRRRWSSLVDHLPDLVTTVHRDGTVTFSNGPYAEGESVLARCADAQRDELRHALEAVARTGESRSVEHRATFSDGKGGWFHTRIGRLPVERGTQEELVLVSTDVTERKDREGRDALRAEMEKLVTEVSTRFINLDAEHLDQHLEDAVREVGERCGADRCYLFDLAGDTLVRAHSWWRSDAPPVPEEVRGGEDDPLAWVAGTLREGGEVVATDATGLRTLRPSAAAAEGPSSLVCVPLTASGETRGFLGFDAWERPLDWDRANVALVRLLADVFANVRERQRVEVERRTLSQQLQQLQKLEAIGTLASGVAHDFNNVLSVIRGQVEVLVRSLGDEAGPPDVGRAGRAAERVLDVVQNGTKLTRSLLDFARGDTGHFEPVDVEDVVERACDMLERTLGTEVVLRKDFRAGGALVIGNESKLLQVFMNLVVNARDAMEGSGTLTIGSARTELRHDEAHLFPGLEPGHYLSLVVSDTGCGMTEEEQQRIFDPCYTTKPEGQGTGLGLFIVYGIVQKHRGLIRVDSRKGAGTSFEVLLPLAPPTVTLPARPAVADDEKAPGSDAVHGHLLVVDDEDLVRETLVELVQELGYEATDAASGAEALELVEGGLTFDALLVDLRMPGMDGLTLLEKLAARGVEAPAVLCSGGATEHQRERLEGVRLAGHLEKPFELAKLSAVLARVLGSGARPAAADLEVTPPARPGDDPGGRTPAGGPRPSVERPG